eukprot:TRINITY_DN5973_c1_g2_i4.p1 TRINITY_DN5973_c1_g2~~TRINITY_DN5973_c1_g2_i4.p1  ORF type:complete len:381 (-),score=32.02 TRINITY_DN5973_c1_g2_i4:369-1511(-)
MAGETQSNAIFVFFGNGEQGCLALEAISKIAAVDVRLVVCELDDPGIDKPYRRSLKKFAMQKGFDVAKKTLICASPNSEQVLMLMDEIKPDVSLSVQCRTIMKADVLSKAMRTVNVHNAPLPLLRGCDPFAWAIHDGLDFFGVTLHDVDLGVDSGAIIGQRHWELQNMTTAWDVFLRAQEESVALLETWIPKLVADSSLPAENQNRKFSSYHPLGQFDFDCAIDWSKAARTVSCFIRARVFPMFQCPTIFASETERVDLRKVRNVAGLPDGCAKVAPGLVSCSEPLMIACWRGQLEVVEVYTRTSKIMIPGKALCLPVGFCVNTGKVSEIHAKEGSKDCNPAVEISREKNDRCLHDANPEKPQEVNNLGKSQQFRDTNAV